jgi:hypothetical protein
MFGLVLHPAKPLEQRWKTPEPAWQSPGKNLFAPGQTSPPLAWQPRNPLGQTPSPKWFVPGGQDHPVVDGLLGEVVTGGGVDLVLPVKLHASSVWQPMKPLLEHTYQLPRLNAGWPQSEKY